MVSKGITLFTVVIFVYYLTSCNIAFLVSKDNVVNVKKGYIMIVANNQYIEFIPSKIDTNLSLSQNLENYKLGRAFYLNGLHAKEINYLKIFGDTISYGWVIIPVELEYIERKEVNHRIRKEKKKYHEHFIQVEGTVYPYQINTRNIRYINAIPELSEEKERQKTKGYEDR